MSNEELVKREEGQPAANESRYRTVSPACDIYENAEEYLIAAEMPGVDTDAVDIRLDRSRLTIGAVRPMEGEREVQTAYARAFEIPDTIDAGGIEAKMSNGVLSVHLPKAPQARVRQITVTAG
ncbi:MAG: Hsp20/alpha crystallin family protein [Nannocystaceae bacterium]|nr:Hsp20/alpha crystallin family protein [bacterium]